ncbi:MAG: Spx/MgsR family RNA polymerase-binding regulatory protein [Sulfurovaceae bacterium]|nr:Spx/MgsR family RNA polymerase-binding regulatory protein [Sulfurovaceae bacterium]
MKLYGIKNCGSVKKAMVFMDEMGIKYEFIDFKKTPATIEQITYWANKVGIDKLLNRKGTTYKKLGLSDMQLDDVQKIKWMAQENSLIKRPVIEYDHDVLVGFDESIYQITFNS